MLLKQIIENQVRYIFIILSVFIYSLAVISCKSSDDDDIPSSASSNGLFVTVGNVGSILTSSDGISWTERTSGTTKNLYGVTYGAGLFVTVGGNATILTSSDGTTWTENGQNLRSNWGDAQYFKAVTYRNKLFVLGGRNGKIMNSPDGITWKQRKSGTSMDRMGVTYAPTCGKVEWKGLDAGLCKNGIFVSVGKNGRILTSFDGNWWVKRTYKLPEWLYAVTYGNGTFVTVGVNGVIITSFDGISWNKRASGNQIKSTDIASVRNTGGDLEIRSTGHGLDVGDVIRFTTTGTLPTGLALSTDYYVVAVPINNSFYVSATESGTPIVYTDEGTGKHAWQSSIALYEGTEQDDEEDTERRARASFPVPSVTIDTLHAVTYSDQL